MFTHAQCCGEVNDIHSAYQEDLTKWRTRDFHDNTQAGKLANYSQEPHLSGMNGLYFAEMDENGREQPTYTLPGVLHFIKHEWAKFERERATWDSERAEFQVGDRLCVRSSSNRLLVIICALM